MSVMYIIYYSGIRPNGNSTDQRLIEMNEVFIMLTNYHILCFTDFTDIKVQFTVGASLINFVMFLMTINFMVMAYNVILKLLAKYQQKKMQ